MSGFVATTHGAHAPNTPGARREHLWENFPRRKFPHQAHQVWPSFDGDVNHGDGNGADDDDVDVGGFGSCVNE